MNNSPETQVVKGRRSHDPSGPDSERARSACEKRGGVRLHRRTQEAAVIAVFSGFARGDLVMFQQMGFGVAVALLLDATVVRLVLVPAAIELLGERNWYLPAWLRRLPDVHVEGVDPRPRRASSEEPSACEKRGAHNPGARGASECT